MGFGEAILTCFRKYVTFQGRARRSEFWFFVLFTVLASFPANIIDVILSTRGRVGPVSTLLSVIFFLPTLSVGVRRLHDVNRPGWLLGGLYLYAAATLAVTFALSTQAANAVPDTRGMRIAVALAMFFVLAVYAIWLFVLNFMKGTSGPNRYGPDPLQS